MNVIELQVFLTVSVCHSCRCRFLFLAFFNCLLLFLLIFCLLLFLLFLLLFLFFTIFSFPCRLSIRGKQKLLPITSKQSTRGTNFACVCQNVCVCVCVCVCA